MSDTKSKTRELYEKVVATQPEFKIKGKASAYTSLNGHMFSFITKEGGLAIRLGKVEQEAFMKKHRSGPVIQYNSIMHGYVHVPDSLLKRTSAAAKLFQESIDYILSLEPKATTKPKKKAASQKKTIQKKSTKKKATKKKVAKKAAKKNSAKKSAPKKKKSTATKKSASKKVTGKNATAKKKATKKSPSRRKSST